MIDGDAFTPVKYCVGTAPNYIWGTQAWAQKVTANSVTVTASPPVHAIAAAWLGDPDRERSERDDPSWPG